MHWTRPLRPARLALSFLRNRPSLAPFTIFAEPLARIADALANRSRHSYFYESDPGVVADDLTGDILLACLPEFAGTKSLRIEYHDRTFQWLLDGAERQRRGRLERVVIRSQGQVVGWYFYRLERSGIADVVQIVATPDSIDRVLDHLFYRTWRQGAVAATGRLDPGFVQVLSDRILPLPSPRAVDAREFAASRGSPRVRAR